MTAWRRRASTLLLDRSPWLRVFADSVELPDGRQVDDFLRVESRHYATIFAVTTDHHVLFVRQYKYGPEKEALQLPAGYLEIGEGAEAGARRELLEETGHDADSWEHLGSYVVDGNRGFGVANFFLARDARPVQAADPGDLEELTLLRVPLQEVPGILTSGQMVEVSPVACVGLALARLGHIVSPA
ncbi:MAG TPA: NUDIX hydrolase [Chloroflexota bacterium]|nr:NUDIX hydrolase [Chloroflexota bacterium]